MGCCCNKPHEGLFRFATQDLASCFPKALTSPPSDPAVGEDNKDRSRERPCKAADEPPTRREGDGLALMGSADVARDYCRRRRCNRLALPHYHCRGWTDESPRLGHDAGGHRFVPRSGRCSDRQDALGVHCRTRFHLRSSTQLQGKCVAERLGVTCNGRPQIQAFYQRSCGRLLGW